MMPAHAAIAHRPLVFSASMNLQHGLAVRNPHALLATLTIGKAQGCGEEGKRRGADTIIRVIRTGRDAAMYTTSGMPGLARVDAEPHHSRRSGSIAKLNGSKPRLPTSPSSLFGASTPGSQSPSELPVATARGTQRWARGRAAGRVWVEGVRPRVQPSAACMVAITLAAM